MHEPVLVTEVIDLLHIDNQAKYIDATVGAGGHSCEIISRGGNVLGIDTDQTMLALAEEKLKACPSPDNVGGHFTLAHGNFSSIASIAKLHGFEAVDGILIDLGISNVHFADKSRGFSFSDEKAPLDMRLDPNSQQLKGSDFLNALREDQLMILFERVLTPPESKSLVRKILEFRRQTPFVTIGDFLQVCKGRMSLKVHPATKPFLALRMAVNSEMENIESVIPQCIQLLKKAGRLAIITFHSTEDRLVKQIFTELENQSQVKNLTKKPIVPTREEIERNNKARSAKLRVIEKL